MKSKKHNSDKFMGSVKVGAKGQIVIPKEVREMFNIELLFKNMVFSQKLLMQSLRERLKKFFQMKMKMML